MLRTLTAGSWKTTSSGILSIAGGIYLIVDMIIAKQASQAQVMAALTTILAGVGLVFARDNDKTSADVGIDTSPAAQQARNIAAMKPAAPQLQDSQQTQTKV